MAAHADSYPVTLIRIAVVAAIVSLYSAAVYRLARRVARSTPAGATIAITWFLAAFIYPWWFPFSRFREWPEPIVAIGYLAAAGVIWVATRVRARPAQYLAAPLSFAVAVMLASGIVETIPRYLRTPFRLPVTAIADSTTVHAARPLPNIYHLVLDGMGRPDVLKARYGLDLTNVISSLTADGFVVEGGAVANYAQTYLSIPSMLNADYLHVPADGVDEVSRIPLHDAIEHNAVFSVLRRAGYEVVFLASDYSATEDNVQATTCRCGPVAFGEFEADVVYRTPFRALWPGNLDYVPHRNRVERTLDAFAGSARSRGQGARYTFAHVLSPHPPFIFKADGTFAPPARAFTIFDASMYPGTSAEYRAGYAQQAAYLIRRAAAAGAALVASDPNAVVIISGDHGPRLGFSALDAQRTDAGEVLPIFLAIHWGADPRGGPRVDTLVNLYRAVLNRYLGTSLTILPTHSYVSSFARPYRLLERDDDAN